jgi:hypothetical protein
MRVVLSERLDREESTEWASRPVTSHRQLTLLCARNAFRCFIIYDKDQEAFSPYRNQVLSTATWSWYGNVVLVAIDGDWPPNFQPRIAFIRSALRFYSSGI